MPHTIGDIIFYNADMLGEGGFGQVFKGRYRKEVAAIKKVLCEAFQGIFLAEIKALAGHEQIVKCYGFERDENFL